MSLNDVELWAAHERASVHDLEIQARADTDAQEKAEQATRATLARIAARQKQDRKR